MENKKLPQGTDYLENVLKRQGVLILGEVEIKTAVNEVRVWLNQNCDSAANCRYGGCSDCVAAVKVIDELLARLDAPVTAKPQEETKL